MLLAEQIRAIEQRYGQAVVRSGAPREDEERFILATGWAEVDTALGGGLTMAALHEWFGVAPFVPLGASHHNEARQDAWTPPLVPLVHLVRQVMNRDSFTRRVIWIGRRCFPYGGVLISAEGDRCLLERSIFVTADRPADRLWAVDLALRCRAVGIVVADGSGFDMAATRKVQLVAKAHRTPALLARPPWEVRELSAAQTRWLVRWEASPGQVDDESSSFNPRWSVELLRCKGRQVGLAWQPDSRPRVWALECDRGQGAVRLSAALAHQAGDAGVQASEHRLKQA